VQQPIGLWLVPALSFVADTVAMRSPRLRWYLVRSCIESVLILPTLYAWLLASMFLLGGGWI
jgi:hypothetical protein